jgi:hypothetical protein
MKHSWKTLYKTKQYTEAAIVQSMLTEHEKPVQILNQQDSSYVNFGDICLLVPDTYFTTANELLVQTQQHTSKK